MDAVEVVPSGTGGGSEGSEPVTDGDPTGDSVDGRGGFRACDLSRVKKNPTSDDLARIPCKAAVSRSHAALRKPADLGSFRLGLGPWAAPWA